MLLSILKMILKIDNVWNNKMFLLIDIIHKQIKSAGLSDCGI